MPRIASLVAPRIALPDNTTPEASGPRWASASTIPSTNARDAESGAVPEKDAIPQIPHMRMRPRRGDPARPGADARTCEGRQRRRDETFTDGLRVESLTSKTVIGRWQGRHSGVVVLAHDMDAMNPNVC